MKVLKVRGISDEVSEWVDPNWKRSKEADAESQLSRCDSLDDDDSVL